MTDHVSRRQFIRKAAIGMGAVSLAGVKPARAIDVSFATDVTMPDKPFMDTWYEGMLAIAESIRDTQVPVIAQAMETAYDRMQHGGTVHSSAVTGHFAMFMGSVDLPGQPNVLPQSTISPRQAYFDALKPGDFLLTNAANQNILDAKERGVYVVSIINSYNRFSRTPPDGLSSTRMDLTVEAVSNLVIDSGVPWDNGLIAVPQIPQLKVCPSTGTANALVYWACTAALAALIGSKGSAPAGDAARLYLSQACDRFRMIGTDRAKINAEAARWADLVFERKARLLVYGHPQDVEPYQGARNMFVNEAYIVASGTMIADQYERQAETLRDSDIVLIGAFTPDNADEVNVARHARSIGAHTVAFCPYGAGRDSGAPKLFGEVDTAFNTYCDESAGVVSVPGYDEPVCPLSGVTGNFVHWMLMAQWTDHMCRRGEPPYFWKGFHENGGKEYDDAANAKYLVRGIETKKLSLSNRYYYNALYIVFRAYNKLRQECH